MDERNPTEATRQGMVEPQIPARLVIAAVRPFRPNHDVIRSAAALAELHDAGLLLLSTLRPAVIDYSQVLPPDTLPLEVARGELFADTVELLYDLELAWSIQVCFGAAPREIVALARRTDVRAVVVGRSGRRWRRIAHQFAVVATA